MVHSMNVLQVRAVSTPGQRSKGNRITNGRVRLLPPLVLTTRSFIVYWIILVILHGLSAVFLISCCQLYWYLEHPYLSYYADLISPPHSRQFKAFGIVLGILGLFNAIEYVGLIFASILAKQPAVLSTSIATVLKELPRRIHQRWKRNISLSSLSSSNFLRNTRQSQVDRMVTGAVGIFGVHSIHFRTLYTLREFIEVGAQVIQCYTFSRLITRVWINHVFVTLIVLNCMSTALLYPALRRWERIARFISFPSVRHFVSTVSPPPRVISSESRTSSKKSLNFSPAFARLMCVLIDCFLSVGTSILLPGLVFWHYARQYEPDEFTFPRSLLYSDTEFLRLIRENQAIFIRSNWDAVYKLVPHLNIFFCLLVTASMLRNAEINDSPVKLSISRSSQSNTRSTYSEALYDELSPFPHHNLHQKRDRRSIIRIKQYFVTFVFIIIAITVLSLHLYATFSNSKELRALGLCRQFVYPWFSSTDSCAVVEFNCYRQNVSTPPDNAFSLVDPMTISTVLFTHCPALIVPESIRSFGSLIGLEIFNSTLIEWGGEAALTNDLHPHMIFLVLALVNMTGLPQGILQTPFPEKLGDIEISHTNLSSLPASLPKAWANVELVYLEYSLLVDSPMELLSIPVLSELSLIGNGITSLPENFSDLIKIDSYYSLALCSNPISSLPNSVRPDLTFGFLSLENTDVTVLPAWAHQNVDEVLYLHGSPICRLPKQNSAIQAGCASRDPRGSGRYPLDLVAPLRLP